MREKEQKTECSKTDTNGLKKSQPIIYRDAERRLQTLLREEPRGTDGKDA